MRKFYIEASIVDGLTLLPSTPHGGEVYHLDIVDLDSPNEEYPIILEVTEKELIKLNEEYGVNGLEICAWCEKWPVSGEDSLGQFEFCSSLCRDEYLKF